jgi:dTDP-4-amino-4,6-dideoxygalactose transaminase
MQVPFLDFNALHAPLREEAMAAFAQVYDGNAYILGKNVSSFEQQFADYCGTRHCVGTANGLDALVIALKVLGIKPNDEVIVQSNAYIASVLAISAVGAKPIFVEPNPQTYNIDTNKIETAISPRTRAIMPVHLYGQPCNMAEICAIAKKYNLYVVEDNAQSHGARWDGQTTGSWGDINATSFYPTKNLGALGDAGAITTQYDAWAKEARLYRNYGSEVRFHNEVKGMNSRLDELQAALLLLKMKYLQQWTSERQAIANTYKFFLQDCPEIVLPHCDARAEHVYHLFVIRHERRDALQKFLQNKGIETAIHYPTPPHLQPAYADLGYKKGDFPVAEMLAQTSLSLPLYVELSQEKIAYICEQIKNFVQSK